MPPGVPAFRSLVVEHLLALKAVDEAGAEQLRRSFAPEGENVMDVMAALGLPASIRLTAVATAAGMPIAPTYLLGSASFDRISHAEACRIDAVPISLVIGGLGLVYANAEVALAGDRGLPAHVAYVATPEVVHDHLSRTAPDAMEAQDTLLLAAPDPALLARARRSTSAPPQEHVQSLKDAPPTRPQRRPADMTSDGGFSFVEHTVEGEPALPEHRMPIVASAEARAALDQADRELSWIPLSSQSGSADPFAGDTLIQTHEPSHSAEDGAHQVLAKLTETGLPEEGVRFSGAKTAEPFSIASEELDSWEK